MINGILLKNSKALFLTFSIFLVSLGFGKAYGQATVTTDKDDYYPGDVVKITGNGWQPGETVKLEIDHSTISHGNSVLYAIADSNGEIFNDEYLIVEIHLGESFYLSALGMSSGYFAITNFTDSPRLGDVSPITQTSSVSYGGGNASFSYTINRGSNTSGSVNATLSITGLPIGVTISGLPVGSVSVGSSGYSNTFTLIVSNTVSAGSYGFTFIADGPGGDDATSSGTLMVSKAVSSTTVTINGGPFTYTGSAIEPATVSVTGAGGLNLSPTATYANNVNAGTATASYSYAGDDNYLPSSDSEDFEIGRASTTTVVTINGGPFTYTGSAIEPATVSVTGAGGLNLSPTATYANNVNAGTATASYSYAGDGNYLPSSDSEDFEIGKKAATVTPNSYSIYCGQGIPNLAGVLSGFIDSDNVSVSYSIVDEIINAVLSPAGVLGNYAITYNTGTFLTNAVGIDASASGTPVPLGSAANLSATVTPNVPGVSVTFTVTNETGAKVFNSTVQTDASGLASVSTGSLSPVGVYKVTATAGTGCASSVAYIPVYDPNDSFVTGGGWINSPAGAMPASPEAVGKANFGFVSKYKKGSSQVDGNTEFQFNAGDINFKSTMHEAGSLVISGGKATYRGTGTINGQAGFKFVVVALDGDWNGGTGADRFRIKITSTSGGTTIYDNQIGKDENGNDATVLGNNGQGGGSIVIHEVKKGNKRVVTEMIEVPWNTSAESVKQRVEKMSMTWFDAKKLAITLQADSYNPLMPGIYEMKVDLVENEFYALDEPISVLVMVQNKPLALDITIDQSRFESGIKAGEVIGILRTVDPADNIHMYSIAENADLELEGDRLIWRGDYTPASLNFTVFSTDRAEQTISREISLRRELKPGEFFLYPNPAHSETKVMLDLDQEATVAIRIYDAIGRMVLENEEYRAGSFTQSFDLNRLAAGMYTVQVKVGNMVMTKRLIKK